MFTNLHVYKSNPELEMDADEQVMLFITSLTEPIKPGYQIISPTPETRIIYFEMENNGIPKLVKGSLLMNRELVKGKDITKNQGKKNVSNSKRDKGS